MARPFQRRNSKKQYAGVWYLPIGTLKVNSETKDADEAAKRQALGEAAWAAGARTAKAIQASWSPAAVAKATKAARAVKPAPLPPEVRAVVEEVKPPEGGQPPSEGEHSPNPSAQVAGTSGDAGGNAKASTTGANPGAPPAAPPAVPIDPAAAANAAAQAMGNGQAQATAAAARLSFQAELERRFPEFSVTKGIDENGGWDYAAAALLFIARKVPELGLGAYFKRRDGRTLETRPSDPNDRTRQLTAFTLQFVVSERWPNLLKGMVTPGWGLLLGLVGGSAVAVGMGSWVSKDGKTRTPVITRAMAEKAAQAMAGAMGAGTDQAQAPAPSMVS